MNILLLNHYAGSPVHGMEFRPYQLAREWVRLGHQVQIVACSVSHVRARNPELQGRTEIVEEIDGITYRWLSAPAYRGNGLGRLLNIATFLARVWSRRRSLAQGFRPDVVIASSTYPLDTWVAAAIARQAGCRWVHEVHDLWPLSLIELSGLSPLHPFVLLCGAAERWACRHADAVVSMLPKVQEHLQQLGLPPERLHIVPNGVAVEDAAQPALNSELQRTLDQARTRGHQVVGYAGSMGLPNALDTLLDAARELQQQPLEFILVGDGHERERLQQRAAHEGLQRVHFLPPIPKAQIPSFLSQLDLAYIGWQPMPLYRFGIAPNKLMDYMLAGCVVLHSVQAGNDPVAESGCGLSVPPGQAQAVAQGLLKLLALPAPERQRMGQAGRAFVLAHHAWPVLAQRFVHALEITPRRHAP